MNAKGWMVLGLFGVIMIVKLMSGIKDIDRTLVFASGLSSGDKPVWYTENVAVDVPASLSARTSGGSVTVEAHDRNEITVDVFARKDGRYLSSDQKAPVEITISKNGNRVEVDSKVTGNGRWFGFLRGNKASVSYRINVPEYTEVQAKTSGGPVSATGIAHNVTLITSGGPVTARNITGDVLARTSGGPITLRNVSGDHTARTSGGSIQVYGAHGSLFARTSGGPITLDDVSGAIDAKTSGGSITANVTDLFEHLKLNTSGGSINALLPPGQGLDISASAISIQNNLADFEGKTERNFVAGSVKGGGIPVEISTSGGSISLGYH